jgi:hypothetical protein
MERQDCGNVPHSPWPPKGGDVKKLEYWGYSDAPHYQFTVSTSVLPLAHRLVLCW